MKRYITGIVAVVVAVSTVAFTLPKNYDNVIFTYEGSDYLDASVKAPANWAYSPTHSMTCNGTNVRACEIEVDPSFVNPDNTLKPLNIQTNSSSTNVYYVKSGGDVLDFTNKN